MITVEGFGRLDGRPVRAFRLQGDGAVSAVVTEYGARLVELHVPDRLGVPADVVLGFDRVEDYATSPLSLGATVGRYGGRIARGRFALRGTPYQLDVNEGRHHVHGGRQGWDRRIWDADWSPRGSSVTFRTTSADGDMGYPGACTVTSTYMLEGDRLGIVLTATPTATTVIDMVHDAFFNLAGHDRGTVHDQFLRLAADFYLPVDADLLVTGEVRAVAGTPFDFRDPRPIGARLTELPLLGTEDVPRGRGYEHTWCLRGRRDDGLVEAAEAVDPASGRRLHVWTTEPGVQLDTTAYLDESVIGKGGRAYRAHSGFSLRSQVFPDAPNLAHFPSAVVEAGDVYRHGMLLDLTPLP